MSSDASQNGNEIRQINEEKETENNIEALLQEASAVNATESEGLQRNKKGYCKYFQMNNCKYTEKECNYVHEKVDRGRIKCKFYLGGNCKNKDCKYMHPPFCNEFLQNKNKNPQGCYKAGCTLEHPKLCLDLEKRGVCDRDMKNRCKFFHRENAYYLPRWMERRNEERRTHWEPIENPHSGARPKANNQHQHPNIDSSGNQNQNYVQYKDSYASKTRSGINNENAEINFLFREMREMRETLRKFHFMLEAGCPWIQQ